jgi:hypothetical protein
MEEKGKEEEGEEGEGGGNVSMKKSQISLITFSSGDYVCLFLSSPSTSRANPPTYALPATSCNHTDDASSFAFVDVPMKGHVPCGWNRVSKCNAYMPF